MSGDILDRLHATLLARRGEDADKSYTARLLARGTERIAQKLGEEAVEAIVAAMKRDRDALIGESADLLYHLLVLLIDAGIKPEDIWAELERREGTSGLAEKASRRS
jgi:phosphoribosyl-ATP pyrophosphohydrolase